MQIINSTSQDIDFIFHLFDCAIAYQTKKGYQLWPQFARELIELEIDEKRHWKIVENGVIVCIFSVMYSDPVIWGPIKNEDPALYLHRITINPDFKGKEMMTVIREWAINQARIENKKFLRMDTWGTNETLRNYYIKSGFNYIGQQYLTVEDGEEPHYGGSELSLFEIEV